MDLKNIKSKIILSKVISKYIKLIKKNYLYWGKCLFHKENTPSFMVNDEKEVYHCFGCGAHGDIFSFLMETHKKPFAEILEELCKTYNIPYKKNTMRLLHTFQNSCKADDHTILKLPERALPLSRITVRTP